MKRLIGITVAALAGLLIASNATAEAKGQNQCDFTASLLQNNGYSAQSTYTGYSVKQLLDSANLDTSNVSISKTQNYHLTYNCNTINNIATATVKLIPMDHTQKTTTVTWTMTKPYYQ